MVGWWLGGKTCGARFGQCHGFKPLCWQFVCDIYTLTISYSFLQILNLSLMSSFCRSKEPRVIAALGKDLQVGIDDPLFVISPSALRVFSIFINSFGFFSQRQIQSLQFGGRWSAVEPVQVCIWMGQVLETSPPATHVSDKRS